MSRAKMVVYVEDEPEMISLVRLILKIRGFTVMGATDGFEGLELMRRAKPDLVLLDLMLPGMSGWDVYKEMKADDELKDIPVIVVTVKGLRSERALGLNVFKVNDYVVKPFPLQRLVQSVCKILGSAD